MANSINDMFFNSDEIRVNTEKLRGEISSHIEDFIAKGGQIQQVNSGVRSVDLNDFNNTGKKAANDKRRKGSQRGGATNKARKMARDADK